MAWGRLWLIAYRDLGRNRRRSILSLLAVALGLALLIVLNGFVAGVWGDALQNSIRLETGHVQLRAESYAEEKLSLQWKDLLENPEALAARAVALSEVKAAAPVLWAGALLSTQAESVNLRIFGIETTSPLYAPIQAAMVAGAYLAPDDRDGILIGKRLADSLGVGVGQRVSLTIVDADGQSDEGVFTIRGLFSTDIVVYDEGAVLMPLAKAQAFTGASRRASAIVLLLHRQEDADNVAAALRGPGIVALTWQEMNQVFLQMLETGMRFYVILDGIVMLIVAVIVVNTLLMAVFERIREMGILAALGMKGRQIMQMFLFEACILAAAGIVVGIVLGAAGVAYLAMVGIPTGQAAGASTVALGSTMYARFVPGSFMRLSAWTLAITVLASLYPAWFAARLDPIEALHA